MMRWFKKNNIAYLVRIAGNATLDGTSKARATSSST